VRRPLTRQASTWALAATAAASLALAAATTASGEDAAPRPTIAPDGVTHAPAFDLPPSSLASPQSANLLRLRGAMTPHPHPVFRTIEDERAQMERGLAPQVQASLDRFPVEIVEQTIAGVHVRVITPKGRAADPGRVLINLHGGAFMMCAKGCAIAESAPIAALGGFKVISIDYREAPEAAFPAANEDVARVYKELLRTYRPGRIGIYGCSAGGALSAEMAAWLPAHGLPQAGAIGVFGAGGLQGRRGDSAYFAGYLDPSFLPPSLSGEPPPRLTFETYFNGADVDGPIIAPARHPKVLARFPPTLIITSTRAPDMSPAIFTHSQLVKAGVPGDLIVGEGLGHCYIYNSDLPEARDADQAIADFFRRNLK